MKEFEMEIMTNAINWFEIPVEDFERARAFYSHIFDYDMPVMDMGPVKMGILPHEQQMGVGGAITHGDSVKPSSSGSKLYLNGGSDLNIVLNRVAAGGGTVTILKTEIGENHGYFGGFLDTEGNALFLHSIS